MTLFFIGIGLNDEKDITQKGLEIIKKCKKVFLETYTSKLKCGLRDLETFYGKKIIPADRDLVEKNSDDILKDAKENDVAFLVIGDSVSATTHIDLAMRAKEKEIPFKIVHNASVITAVGVTGLQIYKFGKTTSIPFAEKSFVPETPYDILKENKKIKAHTLMLLDLRPSENKYMKVNEAVDYLLGIEKRRKEKVFTKDTFCIGCARLGDDNPTIIAGKAKDLLKKDFGEPVHCLIVPGQMHFMEEESLELWK